MAKVIENMVAFKAGELSPYLTTRIDMDIYKEGAKKLQNVIVWAHGGVTKRPGLKFIAECKDV